MVNRADLGCQCGHQVPKGRGSHSEVVSIRTLYRLLKTQASKVPWNDRMLKPSKDRVDCHRKQEPSRWTSLSNSSGHEELSSSRSCKFHMRGSVVVNPSQETTDELWQFSFLKFSKDPRVVDTRICSGKSPSINYLTLVEHTQHGQGQMSRSRKCYPSFAWQ